VPATLDIRETPEGLTFQVREARKLGQVLLTIGVALFFGFLLYRSNDSIILRLTFGTLAALSIVRDFVSRLQGAHVTLRVTNLDLISTGHAPDGYSPSSIPRASIYNLEFREASGGGEDAPNPSGLYVEHEGLLHNPATCVLPHINEEQTQQAIEAILRRFPDTESLAPPRKGYSSDLISLNLNK